MTGVQTCALPIGVITGKIDLNEIPMLTICQYSDGFHIRGYLCATVSSEISETAEDRKSVE